MCAYLTTNSFVRFLVQDSSASSFSFFCFCFLVVGGGGWAGGVGGGVSVFLHCSVEFLLNFCLPSKINFRV